jgi:tRNA wybutosine-synthesizing protein 3
MPQDIFKKRKNDVLTKLDKSSIGNWDKQITSLCEKINKTKSYYTTSSCSGRIAIIFDREKKGPGVFLKVYHDKTSFEQLKKDLKEVVKSTATILFKQEPCGLHVATKTLNDAQNFLDKAKLAGWKKSGIISSNKRFIVECFSTENLSFPIISGGNILVDDNFLKIIVKKSNENLKKSWKKIDKLTNLI